MQITVVELTVAGKKPERMNQNADVRSNKGGTIGIRFQKGKGKLVLENAVVQFTEVGISISGIDPSGRKVSLSAENNPRSSAPSAPLAKSSMLDTRGMKQSALIRSAEGGNLSYSTLSSHLQSQAIDLKLLGKVLTVLHGKHGDWSGVARVLGCRNRKEIQKFVAWKHYWTAHGLKVPGSKPAVRKAKRKAKRTKSRV